MSDTISKPAGLNSAARTYVAGPPNQMKQFAFLIGKWDAVITVFDAGGEASFQTPGRWVATYKNGGRMIVDEFTTRHPDGREIGFFITLRTFCPATHQWEMTFLNSLQPQTLRSFTGRFECGEAHLLAVSETHGGHTMTARVRFSNIRESGFDWTQETSRDGGVTWRLERAIVATRADASFP